MQLIQGLETACSSLRLYPKSKGQTRSRGQGDREEALLYLQRCWIYKTWSKQLNFYTRPNGICKLYLVKCVLLSFWFFSHLDRFLTTLNTLKILQSIAKQFLR